MRAKRSYSGKVGLAAPTTAAAGWILAPPIATGKTPVAIAVGALLTRRGFSTTYPACSFAKKRASVGLSFAAVVVASSHSLASSCTYQTCRHWRLASVAPLTLTRYR